MKKPRISIDREDISIKVHGRECGGHFTVSEEMITVYGPDESSGATQIGNTPLRSFAHLQRARPEINYGERSR